MHPSIANQYLGLMADTGYCSGPDTDGIGANTINLIMSTTAASADETSALWLTFGLKNLYFALGGYKKLGP